jgi:hypothetical protein
MKKRMIYDSDWINQDTEGEDYNYDYHFDDEVCNLNKELSNKILVIAELHLWNGVKNGYRILERRNLNEIMYVSQGCDMKVYVEGKDIIMEDRHHDGTSFYTFRLIKDEDKIHNLTNKIYDGNFSSRDIQRYTTSMGKLVREIYGW